MTHLLKLINPILWYRRKHLILIILANYKHRIIEKFLRNLYKIDTRENLQITTPCSIPNFSIIL